MGPENDGFWKAAPRNDNFACPCYPLANSNKMSMPHDWGLSRHWFSLGNRPWFWDNPSSVQLLNGRGWELQSRAWFFGGDRIILYFFPWKLRKWLSWTRIFFKWVESTNWLWYRGLYLQWVAADRLLQTKWWSNEGILPQRCLKSWQPGTQARATIDEIWH